jgi:hypothetical protein
VICTLNTKRVDQAALAGRTFREVQLLRKQQERQNIDKTGDVAQEVSNWTAQQKAIKKKASARVEAARAKNGIAPNALEADRPAARRAEKEATSPSQALRPLVNAAPASPPTPSATPGRTATILELPQRPKRASGLAARANALKPESAGPIANQGGTQ